MFSPLMEMIIERENLPVVSAETLDEFAGDKGDMILFVAGNWTKNVVTNDVAVILPEILKAANGQLSAAVLEPQSDRKIQLRYRFNKFPSLVFLRNGEYLGVIQKVLDWQDYITEINRILASEPSEPPSFEFPAECLPASAAGN